MVKKGSMPNFKTIDDYISNQSKEAQLLLKNLRALIKEAVPDSVEIPNYKVPSFTLVQGTKNKQHIMIAAYAKFVSFYPFQTTVGHFATELKDYKLGKGSVQFPFDKPLPKDLIVEMVKYRKKEVLQNLVK